MMKRASILILLLAAMAQCLSQVVGVRSNVIPYDETAAVERLAYIQSPFYYGLSGSWKQHRTDSSIVYSRQLRAEKVWKEYLVNLCVRCGHRQRVLVNGKEVGSVGDSRLYAEYNIGSYLKYGKDNTILVEALWGGAETLLEDPAIEVGLNGEPYIVFKSDPGVEDYRVDADYDAATGLGSLDLQVVVDNSSRKGKYYVEAELLDPHGKQFDRMGRWVVFDKKSVETVELTRTWNNIAPWSAESPSLYTLVVRLRDENMAEEEMVGTRIGFRHVEVKDGQLLLNGKPITLKGAIYGIEHTEGDASRQQISRDLALMKQHNFNAVRTARFSPMDDYFYEMCDRYGLYVVCDANLLPHSSRQHAVATDASFVPLFQRRVEDMYRHLKNHSSIVAWSLGDSRDNGVGMGAAYRHLKEIDKTRPTLFPGADFTSNTDIIAPTNPSSPGLRNAVAKAGGRPVVALSMPSDDMEEVDALWRQVEQSRQVQGGFLDRWPMASEALADVCQLFMPLGISIALQGPDEVEFRFENHNSFVGLADYTLEYTIFTNLRTNVVAGDLPLAIAGGGSVTERIRIPQLDLEPGEEAFIRFDLALRPSRSRQWSGGAKLGMGTKVFALDQRGKDVAVSDTGKIALERNAHPAQATLGSLRVLFDQRQGVFVLTDTVRQRSATMAFAAIDARGTRCASVLDAFSISQPRTDAVVAESMGTLASDGNTVADLRLKYTLFATGDLVLYCDIVPKGSQHVVPCLEVNTIRGGSDTLLWYGYDGHSALRLHARGVPGIYTAQHLAPEATPHRAWWATMDGVLFADMRGREFDIVYGDAQYSLTPGNACGQASGTEIHLRLMLDTTTPGTVLSATEFPHVESGIPQPPTIKSDKLHFSEPMRVSLSAAAPGEIRFTTDGTEPTPQSELYKKPFAIETSTTVKARLYPKKGEASFVATRHFNFDYIASTTFSRQPSVPYNSGADTALYDGLTGMADDLTHGWVGFSGSEGLVVIATLARPINVGEVKVRFQHSPATWAFAPRGVRVELLDAEGGLLGQSEAVIPIDAADEAEVEPRVVDLRIECHADGVSRVKLTATTIGRIPAWHRAKGLNPWLLMDEIEVIEKQ